MIEKWDGKKIWIYTKSIDFRKQINGLIVTVVDHLKKEPDDGSIYLFWNQKKDQIKMLTWDRNGYVMGQKKLAKGKFDVPKYNQETVRMTLKEWLELMAGMPMVKYESITPKMYVD